MADSSSVPPILSDDDGGPSEPRRCFPRPPDLLTFNPCEDSSGTSPSNPPLYHTTGARQPTLLERRSREKRFCSASLSSLNAEAILECSRGKISGDSDTDYVCPGWSKTKAGRDVNSPSLNGGVRLVSYNILSQRLISTDRYPHCPTFALAEDYRCSLLEEQLKEFKADIVVLQEVSVDVYEKPLLLGSALRDKYGYLGNHVVITDSEGRSRCPWRNDLEENEPASPRSPERNIGSPVTKQRCNSPTYVSSPSHHGAGDSSTRRSEMEGVCIFYLAERFEHVESVTIRLNAIASADECLTTRERRTLQVASHNVALISVLYDRSTPNMMYIVGTAHLIWQRTECQLWQMYQILMEMEKLKQKYENVDSVSDGGRKPPVVSLILAGDFNADPLAPPVQYALTGAPPEGSEVLSSWKVPVVGDDEENDDMNERESSVDSGDVVSSPVGRGASRYRITDVVMHSLPFRDCYAEYRGRYPERVSAVTPSSNGEGKVLDHILLDGRDVECAAVLRLDKRVELPTKDHPSDHLPVGAIFLPKNLLHL